jgi:putative flippase GtrA
MKLRDLLLRHQTGAIVSTGVDFLLMIAWVEVGRGSPVTGTAIGASSGAVANFLIGRQWIFRATDRSVLSQGLRYALVALGSLGLNSAGEHLMLRSVGLPYVLARVLVAFFVGVSWNFPLHRYFVFPTQAHRQERA